MLSLHRSIPFSLTLKKPGETRAFAFDLEIGLAKQGPSVIDAESGMLINLVEVDALLKELVSELMVFSKTKLDFINSDSLQMDPILSAVDHAVECLKVLLQKKNGIILSRICFKEKRGEFFGWQQGFFFGRIQTLEDSEGVYTVTALYKIPSHYPNPIPHLTAAQVKSIETSREIDFANLHPYLSEIEIERFGSKLCRRWQR